MRGEYGCNFVSVSEMRACDIFFGDNDKNRLNLMSKELGRLRFKIRVNVRGRYFPQGLVFSL
jgi:hypothetical protein